MAESLTVHVPSSIKPSIAQSIAWCDDCDSSIRAVRYKCRDCADFDYCSDCFQHASLIHPGHHFEEIVVNVEENNTHGHTEPISQHTSLVQDPRHSGHSAFIDEVEDEKLCQGCAPIVQVISAAANGTIKISDEDRELPSLGFETSIRLSKLVAAVQRKCSFCSLIVDKFIGVTPVGHGHGHVWSWLYEPTASWYTKFGADDAENDRQKVIGKCMDLLSRIKRDWLSIGVYINKQQGSKLHDFSNIDIHILEDPKYDELWRTSLITTVLELEFFASKDNPAAEFVSSRPPNASPGSDGSLQRVKFWLDEYVQHHGESCRPGEGELAAELPSLVIDVSNGERLCLRRSLGGERGRYTALSYVWGVSGQSFRTTSTTLSDRLTGFSLNDLPRTLQDAVKLTQALDIKYLWIDSLCIIQDLEDHRTKELSVMGQIYKNSYLTICAGRCEDADKPFLNDRAKPGTEVHVDMIPFTFLLPNTPPAASGTALEVQSRPRGSLRVKLRDIPFLLADFSSRRSWCLQESILSPRVIFYDRLRPVWRCNRLMEPDGGTKVDSRVFNEEQSLLNQAILRGSEHLAEAGRWKVSIKNVHNSWQKIVEEYTRRDMTLETDKLPAIGGIAAEIRSLTNDVYLAGLWGQNILSDLMWLTKSEEWLSRPEKWRAPTWSWASVNCPVQYRAAIEDSKAIAEIVSCEIHLQSRSAVGEIKATKTNEAENTLSGGLSPSTIGNIAIPITGEVSAGSLRIQGPLKKIPTDHVKAFIQKMLQGPAPPKVNHVNEWNRLILEHISQSGHRATDDSDTEDKFPATVYELLLFERDWMVDSESDKKLNVHCYSGLFLTEVEDGTFERIGAFANAYGPDLDPDFGGKPFEYREVTIV